MGDDDAASYGGLRIDVIVADAEAGNDLQLGKRGKERIVDRLHRCADRQRADVRDGGGWCGSIGGVAEFVDGEIRKSLCEDRPQWSDQQHFGLLGRQWSILFVSVS